MDIQETKQTFTVPHEVTCIGCGITGNSYPTYQVGMELLLGTHYQCDDCHTIYAVVADGTVICTLGCDFMIEGSHPL